jgi:hypothetical protein
MFRQLFGLQTCRSKEVRMTGGFAKIYETLARPHANSRAAGVLACPHFALICPAGVIPAMARVRRLLASLVESAASSLPFGCCGRVVFPCACG